MGPVLRAALLAGLFACSVALAQPLADKGRYLAAAADCVACHTAENGRPFAGGRPFQTPFGTLYSTNITPDKKTGIGNFSLGDFRATMHRGKGPHGNLYPAMPYTSYYLVRDDDIEALYRYFMQLPPVENRPPANRLVFPANLRFGLGFWNWLYFDPDRPLPDGKGRSAQWRRGNYLVNALGHCGECHTPRNFAQAMQFDRRFAGNVLEGWDAVDIRPQSLRRQGWDREQLRQLLTSGSSERGTLFGEMFRVMQHSLRHLSDEDIDAVITFLLDESEALPGKRGDVRQATDRYGGGRADYVAYCAGCHGRAGAGITLAFAPGMDDNAAIRALNPHNAIAVILRGLPAQRLDRTRARAGMPSFHRELDDARIAELVNFMRGAWGSGGAGVTAEDVARIRHRLDKEGYLGSNHGN
ncbi:cytochrome c [Microbulbifer litoralis]|uniref:cytochrome c n=1 Tax=Microbulbifer litoralis TaxID=2933965 RepID=UPI002027832D|nr:c-type cytochrome [Microbulbifer sp. GX H0434]